MSAPELLERIVTNANNIDDLHRMSTAVVEASFKEYGTMPPTWLIGVPGGIAVITTPYENETEKFASRQVILCLLKLYSAHAFSFASECLSFLSKKEAAESKAEFEDRILHLIHHGGEDLEEACDHLAMIHSVARNGKESALTTSYLINSKSGNKPYLGPAYNENLREMDDHLHRLFTDKIPSELLRRVKKGFYEYVQGQHKAQRH